MGWDCYNDVRDAPGAIRRWIGDAFELVAGGMSLKHGAGVWYGALRNRKGETFGIVWLVERDGPGEYRVKAMAEDEGPYHYDCPLDVLEALTDPPSNEWAAQWRDRVRAYHGIREGEGAPDACDAAELVDGDVIKLSDPVLLTRGPNLLDGITDDTFIVRDRGGQRTFVSMAHGEIARLDLDGVPFRVLE